MHRILLLVAALSLAPSAAAAQPADPPRPADASEVTEAEMALALRLVDLSDMVEGATFGIREMMDLQVQQQPDLAPYRGILEEWAIGVFESPEATEAFARLYAERFTEEELRGVVSFFESPLGQRFAAEQGTLMAGGGEIAERLAEARQGELMERLVKAMAARDRKQE